MTTLMKKEGPESSLWHYWAVVTSVYDGDTVTADIDLGMGIWARKQKLRLYGIDTPELRGDERAEGLKARDWLREQLFDWVEKQEQVSAARMLTHAWEQPALVIVETHKDRTGKYGRWLATLWKKVKLVSDNSRVEEVWLNLNEKMVLEGLAKRYPE
jgi:micrococcal nuclease